MSTSLSNSFVIVSQRLVIEENDGLPADLFPLQKVSGVLLVIKDGEKMIAVLEAQGIEYFVEDAPETKYRIYIQDPDGTALELVEYREDYELRE